MLREMIEDLVTREQAPEPGRRRFAGAPAGEITVGEVMHDGVIICPPESPLRYAAWLMAQHRIHAVVVMGDDEEGGLWGIISDGDLAGAIARGDVERHSAGGVARTPLVTAARSDSVAHAAELMREHGVTHVLVVGARGRPVGVVSTLDLACAVAEGMVDECGAPTRG